MSNLIKSAHYISLDKKKKIEVKSDITVKLEPQEKTATAEEEQIILESAEQEKNNILAAAQEEAQEIMKQASIQAEQMKDHAQISLNEWLDKQKQQEETRITQQEKAGYEQGFENGRKEAIRQTEEEYASKISEAMDVLQLAYARKEEIIQEAEPFLLELSVEIASKILQKTLDDKQEWVPEYIKKLLSSREEQITLCVAPQHFSYIMDFREELEAVVNGDAKLHIIPDRRVTDYGCMIRSSYGTLDARFDTQLNEIKKALLQVVHEGGDQDESS